MGTVDPTTFVDFKGLYKYLLDRTPDLELVRKARAERALNPKP